MIGGGISGLATAFRLKQAGLDVVLLEKSHDLGGAIRTRQLGEFLMDCGPNSTLETSPEIAQFVEAIGLGESRIYANEDASRRYILRDARLHALPMSPAQFVKTPIFSAKGKLRLFAEPFIARRTSDEDETVAAFVQRRVGKEFLDYAINPFTAGVYAGDPGKLSIRSAFAKIYNLEHEYGSLVMGAIKGARARRKLGETAKTKARLFSFKHGMGELIDALGTHLKSNIQTGCTITDIRASESREVEYEISGQKNGEDFTVTTDSVVLTTPAAVTSTLLRDLDSQLAADLNAITYPPVAVLFLGFKGPVQCRPLDGFGFLVPEVEKRKILGCIWSSTIFPGRAPEGGAALTIFAGGMRQPEIAGLADAELIDTVLAELGELLDLQTKPDLVEIQRWPRAIPQYELGHQQKMLAVERFEETHPGIFLSGNYRNGISIGDCVLQSGRIADTVRQHCKAPKPTKPDEVLNV